MGVRVLPPQPHRERPLTSTNVPAGAEVYRRRCSLHSGFANTPANSRYRATQSGLLRLVLDIGGEDLRRASRLTSQRVCVDLRRDGWIRVAQALRDNMRRHPGKRQRRRIDMEKVMKPGMWQRLSRPSRVVRVKRARLPPLRAAPRALLGLAGRKAVATRSTKTTEGSALRTSRSYLREGGAELLSYRPATARGVPGWGWGPAVRPTGEKPPKRCTCDGRANIFPTQSAPADPSGLCPGDFSGLWSWLASGWPQRRRGRTATTLKVCDHLAGCPPSGCP